MVWYDWLTDIHDIGAGEGIEVENTGIPHTYMGLTFRYSMAEYYERGAGDIEEEMVDKCQELMTLLEQSGRKIGRILERYDAIDAGTGDVLVTYRVPVKSSSLPQA